MALHDELKDAVTVRAVLLVLGGGTALATSLEQIVGTVVALVVARGNRAARPEPAVDSRQPGE